MKFDKHRFVRVNNLFETYHLVRPDEDETLCGIDVTDGDRVKFYGPHLARNSMASFYKKTKPCKTCVTIQVAMDVP